MSRLHVVVLVAAALLCSDRPRGQAPPSAGLIRDVAGNSFTLVVKGDGTVVGWGPDADGLAARPPSGRGIAAPVQIELPGKALRVATGIVSAYAVLEDGSVVSWGFNQDGQLGIGAAGGKPSYDPVKVTGLAGIVDVEAGLRYAIALRKDGAVWGWGSREDGALGDGKPTGLRALPAAGPIQIPALADIIQIASGPTHNLALRRDGHVMSWGANASGELGIDSRNIGWTVAEVQGLDHVVAIAAGTDGNHGVSGAVKDDGTVWVWGSNSSGMMGNAQGHPSPDDPGGRNLLPIPVKGVTGAKRLGMGMGHVAALLGDGTLRMWGHDGWGQIGVGTSGGYQEKPMKVTTLTNVAAVYLPGTRSYAVRTDGTLWRWGIGYTYATGLLAKNLNVPTPFDLP